MTVRVVFLDDRARGGVDVEVTGGVVFGILADSLQGVIKLATECCTVDIATVRPGDDEGVFDVCEQRIDFAALGEARDRDQFFPSAPCQAFVDGVEERGCRASRSAVWFFWASTRRAMRSPF